MKSARDVRLMSHRYTHKWTRYTALRLTLALGSLVSMLLASGANGKWI